MRIPWNKLKDAARSEEYADEFTHGLYRYPAGMPPQLVRTLILRLTKPGDLVLDPFCGGGTAAIEAFAHGRCSINSDLNSLACFVTHARAQPLGESSLQAYARWSVEASTVLRRPNRIEPIPLIVSNRYRYAPSTYGSLIALRDLAKQVEDAGARRLALLTVLRLGKSVFDCRKSYPTPRMLAKSLPVTATGYYKRMKSYSRTCGAAWRHWRRYSSKLRILQMDAICLANRLGDLPKRTSLILTSPPYPRVHMLYHRWQLYGRKETSVPYDLLGIEDGKGGTDYTMGSRCDSGDNHYFQKLERTYRALGEVIPPNALVAQILAFAQPERQLPLFLNSMFDAGFHEIRPRSLDEDRVTRTVPHRRWYASLAGPNPSAQEYLFIHRFDSRRGRPATEERRGRTARVS